MTENTSAQSHPAPEGSEKHRYSNVLAGEIEARWQQYWSQHGTFHAPNPVGDLQGDPDLATSTPFFLMDMFPYPSGAGLHVGHPLGYIATDVVGRFRRMQGENVLHALSYDAFGLPAEQYAVQTGQHPRVTTEQNIATMRRQLNRLGLAHDPRRSFATTDPDYVKWTQWIFLQIFNSWFDPDADAGRGCARPITELERQFADGSRAIPDGRRWSELTAVERSELLGTYRLAYVSDSPVNWCPGLGTVLSNEEVTAEGRSERGNFPVFPRSLRQWMMRITAYADRLLDDLDRIEWPDKVATMQRNWIGRSEGARVQFGVIGSDSGTSAESIEVFTTRPDTLFGATFMVVAPEHPVVARLTADVWPAETAAAWTGGYAGPRQAVHAYQAAAAARSALERQTEGREKSGVFSGVYARNPATGRPVPVFVADYVLMDYGTGAIMAVPGEDERDWEFAEAFDLPIVRTVQPPEGFDGRAYPGEGPTINSSNDDVSLNGKDIETAKATMNAWLQDRGLGEPTVTYRLRDWLFSRQRYWGEPFPIVHSADGAVHALPEHMLPVELPDVPDYSPRTYPADDAASEPEPPLARLPEWVEVELDLGGGPQSYRRDTNTMPNWAGSCWYELRYLDPNNAEQLVDPELERYWMGPRPGAEAGGVHLYVGGVEHAVLHLLYARFWHKVLHDLGHVSSDEPFHRLFNQGYIQAYAYTDTRGQYVPAADVVEHDGEGDVATTYWYQHQQVFREYGKIGKSLKNVVSPDEICDTYGADTFRVYEMSMGPLDQSRPWDPNAVIGAHRFLQRVWRNVVSEQTGEVTVGEFRADDETRRRLHRTIDEVGHDMAGMRFNTAIARLIELNNHLTKVEPVPREAIEPLVLMLAPLAPHIAEELWSRLGHDQSLARHPYPQPDPAWLIEESVTCVVQVEGKVRNRLEVSPAIDAASLEQVALADEAVIRTLDGREVRKVIVREPKLVNVVPM